MRGFVKEYDDIWMWCDIWVTMVAVSQEGFTAADPLQEHWGSTDALIQNHVDFLTKRTYKGFCMGSVLLGIKNVSLQNQLKVLWWLTTFINNRLLLRVITGQCARDDTTEPCILKKKRVNNKPKLVFTFCPLHKTILSLSINHIKNPTLFWQNHNKKQ